MGAEGSTARRAVLRSDVEVQLRAGCVTKDVAELVKRWFEDGAPLCLNQEMFQEMLGLSKSVDIEGCFRVFDTDGNQKVDALEVLSAAIFLASGTMDDKIEATYPVFDFTCSQSFSFDEFDIFINSFCRGLTKACGRPLVSGRELIVACRQMFDAYNLPYSEHVTKEQVKRWALNDVEAYHFMRAFHLARPLVEAEAELAQKEKLQAVVFSQLSSGKASVATVELLRSKAFRDALGSPSEEELQNFVRHMAGRDGGAVTLERFVEGVRAWNAFGAVDIENEDVVYAMDVFLLLWYQQHEEPSADLVKQKCQALGVDPEQLGDVVSRAKWLALC